MDPKPTRYHRTLRPGISIGAVGCGGTGTLGLLLETARKEIVMLSAWHVLVGPTCGGVRRPFVLQPGRADGANDRRLIVARVTRHVRGSPHGEAAIARVVRRPVSTRLVGTMVHFTHARPAVLGEELWLSGRTRTHVRGRVVHVGSMETRYSKGPFRGVRVESLPGSLSRLTSRGDSGAVWYSPRDHAAVAMHLEGEKPNEPQAYAKAMPIEPLRRGWNLRFVRRT